MKKELPQNQNTSSIQASKPNFGTTFKKQGTLQSNTDQINMRASQEVPDQGPRLST
jgi:hypothetical protein